MTATTLPRLLVLAVVVSAAAILSQAKRSAEEPFPNTVSVHMSAFLDFSKHRVLFKILAQFRKNLNQHAVLISKDFCFWDITGDMNSDQLGNKTYAKVAAMLKEILQTGERSGTVMYKITDKEWLEVPHAYHEECDENRTFTIVPTSDTPSNFTRSSGEEQSDEPTSKQEGKDSSKKTSTKKNGSNRLQLKGCIEQGCRDQYRCVLPLQDGNRCSRGMLECSYKCRRTAIAFQLSPSDKKTVLKQGNKKDAGTTDLITTKRNSKRNNRRSRRRRVRQTQTHH